MTSDLGLTAEAVDVRRPRGAAAELGVLLPDWQAAELERLAWARGLTVGQLVRRLIAAELARARRSDS